MASCAFTKTAPVLRQHIATYLDMLDHFNLGRTCVALHDDSQSAGAWRGCSVIITQTPLVAFHPSRARFVDSLKYIGSLHFVGLVRTDMTRLLPIIATFTRLTALTLRLDSDKHYQRSLEELSHLTELTTLVVNCIDIPNFLPRLTTVTSDEPGFVPIVDESESDTGDLISVPSTYVFPASVTSLTVLKWTRGDGYHACIDAHLRKVPTLKELHLPSIPVDKPGKPFVGQDRKTRTVYATTLPVRHALGTDYNSRPSYQTEAGQGLGLYLLGDLSGYIEAGFNGTPLPSMVTVELSNEHIDRLRRAHLINNSRDTDWEPAVVVVDQSTPIGVLISQFKALLRCNMI